MFHLQIQESFPFSVGFSLNEGQITTLSNGPLFPKGHLFPSMKILTLQRNSTFQLEAFYTNQNELPSGTSTRISDFVVQMKFFGINLQFYFSFRMLNVG